MRSLMKKLHRSEKGLTLIELLIVVAILGIIAAVVIPNLGGFMITGRISAANTELENVKTAALAYYAEYGAWPESTEVDGSGTDPENAGDFSDYMAGGLTVNYTFCSDYGWVLTAYPEADYPDGITFQAHDPAGEGHGRWVRD